MGAAVRKPGEAHRWIQPEEKDRVGPGLEYTASRNISGILSVKISVSKLYIPVQKTLKSDAMFLDIG